MFPSEQFTLKTRFSPDRVCQKLLEVVEPPQSLPILWDTSEKPYEGKIGEHSFRISRVRRRRNSLVSIRRTSPRSNSLALIVTGRIQGDDTGSQIDIQIKIHPFIRFFLLVWLGMLGFVCLGTIAEIVSLQRFDPSFLTPFGMFAFIYSLPFFGFNSEANFSKQFLIDLFSR